jgi:AsmA-like C-terminal region
MRYWGYGIILVLAIFLVAIIAIPLVVEHIAKAKLKSVVAERMNATLEIGGCSYWPPYSLTFRNLSLIAHNEPLLNIDQLNVKLSTAGWGKTEVHVTDVAVVHPVLHMPAGPGSSNLHDLIRSDEQPAASATAPSSPAASLPSLQRWQIDLVDAEIIRGKQDWKNFDLQTQITPDTPMKFSCSLNSQPGHSLLTTASGTIDLNQNIAEIRAGDFSLAINDVAGSLDYLPQEIQQALRENHVAGVLHLRGSGEIPLQHPEQSTFAARFDLTNAHADNAEWPAPLDEAKLSLDLNRAEGSDPVVIGVREVYAISGPTTLRIQRARLTADLQHRTWAITKVGGGVQSEQATTSTTRSATRWSKVADASRRYTVLGKVDFSAAANGGWPAAGKSWPRVMYKILAYPQDASFVVPSMEAPIEHISGGPVRLTDDHLELQNLSAHYGYDLLQVENAQLRLNDANKGLGVSSIEAEMKFDRNSPPYPQPIASYMKELHPQGPFHIGGRFLVYPTGHVPPSDYALTVSSPDASFAMSDYLIPVEHAKLNMIADESKTDEGEFRLNSFKGSTLGGTLSGSAEVKLQTPFAVAARANFSNVDVKQAYAILASRGWRAKAKESPRASGKANGDLYMENPGTDWQTAKGGGTVEITGGNFGNIPILSQLGKAAHFSDSDFVGSEAAAVFTVAEQIVQISNVAVSAPAVGIQGDGYLKFAGPVHLHVVVAPLADWRQKLKSTGIPIIGDAAGALQTLLNHATRTLFYEFNITGDIRNPTVAPVPVPFLTKGAGRLFSHMLSTKNDQNLLDLMKPPPTTNP